MSLKIGAILERKPVRITLSLLPDLHATLVDYAAIHAAEFGRKAPVNDLAILMIERFLDSDAAFRRARKSLHQPSSEKE